MAAAPDAFAAETASGAVYHDRNGNDRRDSGEEGLPGVAVSNGRDVVLTDAQGRWSLSTREAQTVFFVIKPNGWQLPVNERNLPQFYYVHAPEGSPDLGFPGLEPTGPLPASIDFGLRPGSDEASFRAVIFGDTQPYSLQEVDYMIQTVVPELAGTDAAFGITLGDVVGDDLDLFDPYVEGISQIGLPWFHVAGNHDINYEAADNRHSTDTFMRRFGPRHYAFTWGEAHFIVLYNVDWRGGGHDKRSNYGARFHDEQLDFIEAYLETVPREDLIVLAMHIPIRHAESDTPPAGTERLFELLKDRPNTLSLAAHRHTQEQFFFGPEEGWQGSRPHHHLVQGTVSGTWWRGSPDEFGIPHSLMRDGTPRGYAWLEIEGNEYVWRYKASGRPADFQLFVDLPERIEASATNGQLVRVNVFGGNERSRVRMRLDEAEDWTVLERVIAPDDRYSRIRDSEAHLEKPYGRPLRSKASPSLHLWETKLPSLEPGPHTIEVETVDMFGQRFVRKRVLIVTNGAES